MKNAHFKYLLTETKFVFISGNINWFRLFFCLFGYGFYYAVEHKLFRKVTFKATQRKMNPLILYLSLIFEREKSKG